MKEFAEMLIERLEEASHYEGSTFDEDGYCNDDSWEVVYLDKAIEIVNQLAEEYVSEINAGKWIPCSERLPEEIGRYIVSLKDGRSLEGIYNNASKNFVLYENEVVAWMYMPQPYKPEKVEV